MRRLIADVPKGEPQKSIGSEFVSHVETVKFFTNTLRTYTLEDLTDDSNNTHLHVAPGLESSPLGPGSPRVGDHLVSVYLQKLDAKRPVSQVRQNPGQDED